MTEAQFSILVFLGAWANVNLLLVLWHLTTIKTRQLKGLAMQAAAIAAVTMAANGHKLTEADVLKTLNDTTYR